MCDRVLVKPEKQMLSRPTYLLSLSACSQERLDLVTQMIFDAFVFLNNVNINTMAMTNKKKTKNPINVEQDTSTAVSCTGQHPAVSSNLPILCLKG